MKTNVIPRRAVLAVVLAVSAMVAAACGSDNNNPSPGGGTATIVGSSSSGTTSSNSGTRHRRHGQRRRDRLHVRVGPPANNTDFLNACNGMTCNHFDNKAKLPLLKADGTPPALP